MNNIHGGRMLGIAAVAIVIVVTVGVLVWKFQSGFGLSKNESLEKVDVIPERPKGETLHTKEDISENRVYRNEKYGFQVTLPKGWEGYRAIERESNISGVSYVDFGLPTNENPELWHGVVNVGTIGVWTKEAWNQEKVRCAKEASPDCPSEYDTLGNNALYFFDYTSPQDVPSDIVDFAVNPDYFQKNIKFLPTGKETTVSASDMPSD